MFEMICQVLGIYVVIGFIITLTSIPNAMTRNEKNYGDEPFLALGDAIQCFWPETLAVPFRLFGKKAEELAQKCIQFIVICFSILFIYFVDELWDGEA